MKSQVKDAHVYFPIEVMADLKDMAKENRRTVSAEIVIAVENKLQEWKSQGEKAAKNRKKRALGAYTG